MFQQDIILANIPKYQRYLGLILGITKDGSTQLVHGRDARSSRDQSDVFVFVGGPRVLGERTLEVEPLFGTHAVEMFRHGAVGVLLDDEFQVALGIY